MMILVRFRDGSFGKIPAPLLGRLLSSREVTHFRRSEGWVRADSPYLRTRSGPPGRANDRRSRLP